MADIWIWSIGWPNPVFLIPVSLTLPFALQDRYKRCAQWCLTALAAFGVILLFSSGLWTEPFYWDARGLIGWYSAGAPVLFLLLFLLVIWRPFSDRTRRVLLLAAAAALAVLFAAEIAQADRITDHERYVYSHWNSAGEWIFSEPVYTWRNFPQRYRPVWILVTGALLTAGAKQRGKDALRRACLSVLAVLILLGFCYNLYHHLSRETYFIYGKELSGALFLTLSLLALLLVWRVFRPRLRAAVAGLLIAAALASAFGTVYGQRYHESLAVLPHDEPDLHYGEVSDVPLEQWEPFREDTRAARLDSAASLALDGFLPVIDGATALYPLYASFVMAVYPEGDYPNYDSPDVDHPLGCTRTANAFGNLVAGRCDIVFLMGVSDDQREYAKSHGVEIRETPVGREAFGFIVNALNTVSGLSSQQVRGIYSGKITNWSEVGGERSPIRLYGRPEDSGSYTALLEVMEGMPLREAERENVFHTMGGMVRAVADYRNYSSAIGYTFRFYLQDMVGLDQVKMLAVDGASPDIEHISDGSYPFISEIVAVTVESRPEDEDASEYEQYLLNARREREENTGKLLEWILSAEGQTLVERTGYVPAA